ncbi:HTH-type transcriptional activator CmpR [uncultured Flavonifractor sp.]|nr:HTH-type transcriptional activator CmpR [uncultured Flavonifractor sp.]
MNISLEYFLIVAQEQSISRGAERAMVSQQDMSNHIRRLEKQYGRLFDRRPKFALTPAGQAVLDTYLQVRMLERSLTERLQNLKESTAGTIRLGLHIARARILLPKILERFSAQYPGVNLEVTHGDTAVFEQLLEQGDLHLFLGINPTIHSSFMGSSVGREPVYLIAAEKLLNQCFPNSSVPDTLSPDQLQKLPLIFSPTVSTTQLQISDFFQRQQLNLHPKVTVGDFDLQLRLAIQGIGCCFCPNMHLSEVRQFLSPNAPVLRRLTVTGLELWNDVKIVRNKRMYHPHYLDVFESILEQEARIALSL